MGLLPAEQAKELQGEHLQADIAKPPAPKLRSDEGEFAPEVQAKPAAASGEPALDEETQKFIVQSLTDVDLFASYGLDRKSTRLNSSHGYISYAVFCLKKKNNSTQH